MLASPEGGPASEGSMVLLLGEGKKKAGVTGWPRPLGGDDRGGLRVIPQGPRGLCQQVLRRVLQQVLLLRRLLSGGWSR